MPTSAQITNDPHPNESNGDGTPAHYEPSGEAINSDSSFQQASQALLTDHNSNHHSNSFYPSCSVLTSVIHSSFCQDSSYLLKRAMPLAGSLAFCWQIFLVGVLGSWLNDSHESEFNAAINWIQTFMATCLALALSPLSGINYPTSMHLARINELAFDDDPQSSHATINEIGFRLQLDPSVNVWGFETIREPINNMRAIFHAGFALSPLLMILGGSPLYYADIILKHGLAQSDQTADLAQSFLRPYSLALVGLTLRTVFEQFLFANQHYKQTMLISLLGLAIGTGLSACLSYGFGMGLEGLAIGYTIEAWLTAAMMGIYVTQSDHFEPFNLFSQFDARRMLTDGLSQLSRYGFTQTATDIFELGATFGYSALTSTIGADAQAGWQAVMQLPFSTFPLIAAMGIVGAQTVESLQAQGRSGAEIQSRHWHNTLTLAGVTTALSVGAIGVIGYYPNQTLGHYDTTVKDQLPELISIIAAGHLLDALRYQQLQACKGIGDNLGASTASIFGLIAGIGMAAIITQNDKDLGAKGTAVAYTLGMFFSWISLAYLWQNDVTEYHNDTIRNQHYIEQTRSRASNIGRTSSADNPLDLEVGNNAVTVTLTHPENEALTHQSQLVTSDFWAQDRANDPDRPTALDAVATIN